MAILDVLTYPDPRLARIAEPIKIIDNKIKRLVDDMAETMYDAPGIGLAAPQVGELKRIMVIDVSEERNQLRVFINPEIIRKEGTAVNEEGCLSVPGFYDKVERAETVMVTALDRDGQRFTINASGLLAVCIQHEMDHLEGHVFVEYLSPLKANRIRNKLIKRQRELERETELAAPPRRVAARA
ncbi:MAG TPA: peptide deformylase [Usitatibacteraceae bacterium]|nr:peptide deformylase [Usitatibacteraceae bacterium]